MSIYSDLAVMALEILAEFGQVVEFHRDTAGDYIPGVGVSTQSSRYVVTMVTDNFNFRELESDLLQMGDAKAMASCNTAPAIGDTASINGKAWRVQNVSQIAPAGEVVVYELQLRS